MKQIKWFDRKFDFSNQQNIMPSIIERLIDTPIRLKHNLADLPDSILGEQLDGKWSILENLGHLADLEPLWQLRLNDILNGRELLTAADLKNNKTHQAGHNLKSKVSLLMDFETLRKQTIDQLRDLSVADIFKSSLHPRLRTPLRTMDLFLFVAEHDDHHLQRISEIALTAGTWEQGSELATD